MRLVVTLGLLGALLACTGAGSSTPAPSLEPSAEAPEAGGGKAGKRKGGKGGKAGKAGDGPVIAKLAGSHLDGCGCSLSPSQDPVIEIDLDRNAWLNVDGVDVIFGHSRGRTPAVSKLGETSDETFTAQAQGLVARVRWTVSHVCEGVECEGVGYDAEIEVERGGRSSSVTASGNCGC